MKAATGGAAGFTVMCAANHKLKETADVVTSSDDYSRRFSGAVGSWMLARQQAIIAEWLGKYPNATILDVGGGHGQLAAPLAQMGYRVTVLGSEAVCSQRIENDVRAKAVRFVQGDLVKMPFSDQSFDVALSVRLMAHCERWPELVRELCRVTRKMVIVDYPTVRSVNFFSSVLFHLKKRIEGNTRPYALFRDRQVVDEFEKNKFGPGDRRAQFFFPMALHRCLGLKQLSVLLEAPPMWMGLTSALGSPVLLKMVRKEIPSRG